MTDTTKPTPCPFCDGDSFIDACDRVINIGCKACGYSRAFRGLLQTKESPVRVSEREFYHRDAKEEAIAAWNRRPSPSVHRQASAGQEGEYVMVPVVLPRHARMFTMNGEKSWAALLEAISVPLSTAAPESGWRPIDMVLHCPACGKQHVDAPDERTPDWKNEPHRSHLCHGCGHIWRPADVPTNGVAAVKTKGQADSVIAKSASQREWRAIETAPKDGKPIILGFEMDEEYGGFVGQGRWHEEDHDGPDNMGHDAGFLDDQFDFFKCARSFGNPAYQSTGLQPTHWQPLPAAPTAGETL